MGLIGSVKISVAGKDCLYMDVSENSGFPPNHPILIGFSIIFTIHFGVPQFLETPILHLPLIIFF